ncbi:MAG: Tm-1-like ATP-binding domain-containing protein [Deltaproteobacteria bacterium]|nr:Tm-1-like ATP-binding domain-containing protein [Deltaproteobacteria bacterium]
MKNSREVLLVATMDTKWNEAGYIQTCLAGMEVPVRIMDAGIRGKSPVHVDVDRQAVAAAGGKTLEEVQDVGHEGKALEIMIRGARNVAEKLYRQGKIHGIIGLGGSMGTTLGTAVMRQFPIGFPKVMISTMASRDTRDFVGTKDILMLHSVCDLSGLNRITRKVLLNGAGAMAGMLRHMPEDSISEKPLVILSTLGTTESCVQRIREYL